MDQELLIKINGSAKNFIDEFNKAKKATADLEKSLTQVAKVSSAAFIGLAAAVGGTVARFSSFEKGFTNVVTLLDKGSFSTKSLEKGIDSLKNGVIALSADSGESLETLNAGLFNLVSSGVAADDAIDTLAAATQLAIAGATDTDTAVKALTSTLTSFGEEAGTAAEIAEKFFTAQKFGVTTVGELATEFNKVAGISKQLGLSFDETLASLSALTADGAKPTSEAATQLRASLNSIILVQSKLKNESAAVQDALSLQNVRQRGLIASLDLLKNATGGNVSEIQRLLGSSEALAAVLSLTGNQSELVKKQMAELGDEFKRNEVFQEALRVKNETTEKALARLRASADAVAVVFGEFFAPTINAAAGALSSISQNIVSLDKSTLSTIATITKWTLALTGTVALVSGLTLAYIKIRRILLLVNATLNLSTNAVKLYNFTLALGNKAALLFSRGMAFATASVRGFAAATGIGLVLVALSLMITHMKETAAIAAGTFAGISKIAQNFANGFFKIFDGIGTLLVGIFTLDKDKILEGLNSAKAGITEGIGDIGKGAGDAFNKAFQQSLRESEAAEIPPPEVPEEEQKKKVEDEKKRDPASDTSNLDNLVKKEEEAAARIREIRARENDLLKDQADRAALDRVVIKDAELKAIQDQEKKSADDIIKLKSQQINLLKQIDKLDSENSTLAAKEKLTAKEQVNLEANQRELDILRGQLQATRDVLAANTEAEVIEEQERNAAKLERIAEQFEEEQALKAELQELTDEQRALLDEEDLEKFRAQIQTKKEIEQEAAGEELQANIARRNKFLKDEQKFGTDFAKIKQFFSSQEVQLADQTAGQLVALTNSKNSALKGIGKAAALTQIGIKTAEGAISAFASLSGIPIVGPALGAAAAGALIAFGAEQASAVLSAQGGGIVPEGLGGDRDRIPALLEPGELVVPKALAPDFIQSVGRPDGAADENQGASTEVTIGFTDDAFRIIEQKLLENRAIGTGTI